jgi:hypothetical protein
MIRDVRVVAPDFSLVSSGGSWVDLDFLLEVSNLLALLPDFNKIGHTGLGGETVVDVEDVSLVHLDLFKLLDALKLMTNDLFQVHSHHCSEQLWLVRVIIFIERNRRQSNTEVINTSLALLKVFSTGLLIPSQLEDGNSQYEHDKAIKADNSNGNCVPRKVKVDLAKAK